MPHLPTLLALALVAVPLSVESARAEYPTADGGFAQLLSRYDRNGNGLLEPHERAAMLAPKADQEPQPLSAFPLVCEGEAPGGSGGGSSNAQEDQESAPRQVARLVALRGQPFAENQPPGQEQPQEGEQAASDSYAPETPAAPRQPVQFRNAVQYRMLLNEQQAQPRSQPFAQAATFGPMVGRVRHYPRRGHFAHSCCGASRASFYLAQY